jgi:hypothetical protein
MVTLRLDEETAVVLVINATGVRQLRVYVAVSPYGMSLRLFPLCGCEPYPRGCEPFPRV